LVFFRRKKFWEARKVTSVVFFIGLVTAKEKKMRIKVDRNRVFQLNAQSIKAAAISIFLSVGLASCGGTSDSNTSGTVTTAPNAPSIASVVAADAQALVVLNAPSGSTVTGYTVTSNPAGGVDSNAGSSSLSHIITGLTNGTSYTFTAVATNSFGNSPASAPSNAVIPSATAIPGLVTKTAADFSLGGTNDFNGASSSLVTNQPAGGSQTNAAMSTSGVSSQYFGTTFLKLTNQEFCTTANPTIGIEVYSPVAAGNVRLKLEQEGNGAFNIEMDKPTVMGWQTLSFDCVTDSGTATTPPTAAYAESTVYNVASIFFGFPGVSAGETWYFDKVAYVPTAAVTYVPPAAATDPTVKPAAPTVVAPNFISIIGTTLGDMVDVGVNPPWGQATVMTSVNIAGDTVLKYANLNYQGMELAPATGIDVTGMTDLHIDIYAATTTALDVFLISPGPGMEQAVTVNPTTLGWNSFDIPLSSYTIPALTNIFQFKFVGTPAGNTVYIDNLYFWKGASGPATAPNAPTIGAAIAGDSQATVNFTAPAIDGGSAITGYTVTSTPAGGTDANAGTTALSHNITGLTNGTAYTFTVTATNAIGTSVASAASNAVTPAVPSATIVTSTAASWTLGGTADFGGNASSLVAIQPLGGIQANAAQVDKTAGAQTWAGTTFLTLVNQEFCTTLKPIITANVYSPVAGATVRLKLEQDGNPALNIEMDASTVMGWQTLNFDCLLSSGAATTPPTAAYVEGTVYNKASILFNFGVSPAATETWYFDQVTYDPIAAVTYVPPVAAADPMTIPAAPTVVAANVVSVFGTTYGHKVGITYPNWGQATVQSIVPVLGDDLLKLANLNYQGIDFVGSSIDVSTKTNLHLDMYASASLTPVNVFLISTTGGLEQGFLVTPSVAGWNSFDIPLTNYTTPTLTVIDQLKFDAQPNVGDTVFIDNLYFW